MSILNIVKESIGIASTVDSFDAELTFWINDAIATMEKTAGIPASLIEAEDPRAVCAILSYIKANFGNDRTDTNRYMSIFRSKVRQLQTEDGGAWDAPND